MVSPQKLNSRGSRKRNTKNNKAIATLAITVTVSLIVVGAVVSGVYVMSISQQHSAEQTTLSTSNTIGRSIMIGSVNFSSIWHYTGNVTLSGSESVCSILRIPCAANPQNPAEELMSTNATVAYAEIAHGCGPQNCMTTTIVLINNNLYCVSPKSNISSQPECPKLIN